MLDQRLQFSIIGNALDAGITYDDDLFDTCSGAWLSAFPATDCRLPGPLATGDVVPGPSFTAALDALRAALANTRRGTWTSFNVTRPSGHLEVISAMSNGVGGQRTVHNHASTFDDLLRSMISMELYEARRAFEAHREAEKALTCIATGGLRLSHTFRNVYLCGQAFSTAIIVGIDDSGKLDLVCTRRGSAKRWKARIHAHRVQSVTRNPTQHVDVEGKAGSLF
ncbi:hypothetical protein H8Z72_22520 (plasmid) [Xanthomonas citri pv. citri]|uniref:hypothetical protein n=1 Tax=Xanthomonas citri TaxID=346 RepID=UPI0019316581|nr:hypothetical protein [Xanthomonas citri]QRD62695.1 hypothetical protein H8Z74_22560 [Xanthomonas citri pv. citri]QRD67230.1 hypothetical protein H8Z73_22645 [Xanthomonas citri pv. citri]QRD71725.1 hypothetical protein H8Z72_22520 [Xanthomonas citri pv. citri]